MATRKTNVGFENQAPEKYSKGASGYAKFFYQEKPINRDVLKPMLELINMFENMSRVSSSEAVKEAFQILKNCFRTIEETISSPSHSSSTVPSSAPSSPSSPSP